MFAEQEGNPVNLGDQRLKTLLTALNRPKRIIGHNIKFDLAVLYKDGFEITETQELVDTITAARMYFPDKYQKLDLGTVSDILLKTDNWKGEFHAFLKKHKWHKNYDQAPADVVGEYCINDCKNTFRIYEILTSYIDKTQQNRVWDQECALLKVLWKMEKEGLYFDRTYCEDRLEKIKAKLYQIEQQIYALVGKEFDISSPKQIGEIMTGIGITSPHKTPTGQLKWGVAELLTINHPIASLILDYRGIEKMRSSYFEPLLVWEDDRQHPSFKPWGTVTGRMSCERPALQTLSNKSQDLAGEEDNPEVIEAIKAMMGARAGQVVDMTSAGGGQVGGGSFANLTSYAKKYEDTDTSVAVRRLYIAPPGYYLYCMDVSQMEMRVFADYVKDETLTKLLDDGSFDFHSYVVKEVWKIEEDSALWKFYRNLAKAINFGLLYGIGDEKLAAQIQKTKDEATAYKEQYFDRFPKARDFMNLVMSTVKTRGYIKNRFGRRYTIDPDKAYVGVNYLIQGSSADIVKSRMVAIDKYLKDKQTKMVCQVHDELVFYVKIEEEKWIVPELKRLFEERQIETFLPIEVSKAAPSWAEKKKMCVACMEFKESCKCEKK